MKNIRKVFPKNGRVKCLIVVLSVTIISIILASQYLGSIDNLRTPIINTTNVENKTSLICQPVVYLNDITSWEQHLVNGIEGGAKKKDDKMAIIVRDSNTIGFVASTKEKFGINRRNNFRIIDNSPYRTMAVWFNRDVMDSVILNKKNGLAIWLKGAKSSFVQQKENSIIYLMCR